MKKKISFSGIFFIVMLYVVPYQCNAAEEPSRFTSLYPEVTATMRTEECMQCHPSIAKLLRTAGAMHGHVECRQCHLQVHAFISGQTTYEDILPKCETCHGQPHGKEQTRCSACHQEAHAPLNIPASRALSQGCYTCHPKLDKEVKIFPTRHTDLYCTACHHTRHGFKPNCRECHEPHIGQVPGTCNIVHIENAFDQCVSCHPPHKALKVAYPADTPNEICAYCHRKAQDMLNKSNTKHTTLLCIKCHPDLHKTIKRCKECHGKPHPEKMLNKYNSCGACHGVAHSVVR